MGFSSVITMLGLLGQGNFPSSSTTTPSVVMTMRVMAKALEAVPICGNEGEVMPALEATPPRLKTQLSIRIELVMNPVIDVD
ncbi:hypothetical protein ACLB2K_002515 [Fragaria x ananassa]